MLANLIEILRVYYNYVLVGGDKRTAPAMRLGLMERPASVADILAFSEAAR